MTDQRVKHDGEGYTFELVNVACLPTSTLFNVVMYLDTPIGPLLGHVAAEIDNCTYGGGSGPVNFMDDGHIVAIYADRVTVTGVTDTGDAKRACDRYLQLIRDIESRRDTISPVDRRRPTESLLDIYRVLPQTNCGLCPQKTCMAFAASVYRRESTLSDCLTPTRDPNTVDDTTT